MYTENYLPGGGNRYLIDIANSIDPDKELFIISNHNGLFLFDFERIDREYSYREVPVITLPSIYSFIEKQNIIVRLSVRLFIKYFHFIIIFLLKKLNTFHLSKILNEMKPEIIFCCNGGYPGGYSCSDMIFAAKSNNIPIILTVVSVPQASRSKIFDFFYGKTVVHCQHLVVNASIISKAFINNWPFLEKKITVIHNCVNMREFVGLNKNFSKEFKSKYNCENSKIIGYIGRIEESKGVYVLLDAFSKVIAYNENVKLIMVGSGEIEKAKQFSDKLGIDESVVFTGFYDGNIIDVLNSFDIFVFPSFWEGFPYAILEAMALKKIIVSTNVGGIPEAIENNVTGLLVNPYDSNQLASEIIRILKNYNAYKQLGINAYNKVISKLSISEFSRKINELIN